MSIVEKINFRPDKCNEDKNEPALRALRAVKAALLILKN